MTDRLGVSTHPSLLERLRDPVNNEAAWRTFLESYKPLIYRWCCRKGLKHHQAEDVTAEVLAKLVPALRTFTYDPARRFRSWLSEWVNHAIFDIWRRERPTLPLPDDVQDPDEDGVGPGKLPEDLERELCLAELVVERVKKLVKPHTWQAFWLTAIQGMRGKDVARELHLTVANVFVARMRVNRLLGREGARLRRAEGNREEGPK